MEANENPVAYSIAPHGGKLVELVVDENRVNELKQEAIYLPSWDLTQRQVWDIELLLNGAFSPLVGFMGKADYESVCEKMRLTDGTLWPIPITLDVTKEFAGSISEGERIALRHPEGMVLAIMTVTDIWDLTAPRKLRRSSVPKTTSILECLLFYTKRTPSTSGESSRG